MHFEIYLEFILFDSVKLSNSENYLSFGVLKSARYDGFLEDGNTAWRDRVTIRLPIYYHVCVLFINMYIIQNVLIGIL